MNGPRPKLAILFPADQTRGRDTNLQASRLSAVADAFIAAGVDVTGAPYADAFATDVRERLLQCEGVLVWFNPSEAGRDRTILNSLLRDVAGRVKFVSAHPDVIDRIGTKEVLYRTRHMSWGADTYRYASLDALRSDLLANLKRGPRVLKQMRGQSGDGVWRVELAEPGAAASSTPELDTPLNIRHAKRGSQVERSKLSDFLAVCRPYFERGEAMIDQAYQQRLPEGMVRCYVVRDRVAGFGEQRVNALYPAPLGGPASTAPQPGPRLYYPPTRPDFQALKTKLETKWIAELCRSVSLDPGHLPVLWDADFLYGPKDETGADTFVLCEINVSSVYPFPPDALSPLVAETMQRLRA